MSPGCLQDYPRRPEQRRKTDHSADGGWSGFSLNVGATEIMAQWPPSQSKMAEEGFQGGPRFRCPQDAFKILQDCPRRRKRMIQHSCGYVKGFAIWLKWADFETTKLISTNKQNHKPLTCKLPVVVPRRSLGEAKAMLQRFEGAMGLRVRFLGNSIGCPACHIFLFGPIEFICICIVLRIFNVFMRERS